MADVVLAAGAVEGVAVPAPEPLPAAVAVPEPVAVPVPAPPAPDVKTVEVDGVRVQVNMSYVRSWEGVMQAKRMQDTSKSEQDRFWAMVEYYDRVCPNASEVAGALGGESVDVSAVFAAINRAVKAATPKN